MEPELKQKLDNIQKLAEENNTMLKHVRRGQRWTSFFQAVYWLIIISLGVGTFYFIQPYFNQAQKFIKDSGASIDQLRNLGSNIPFSMPR